MGSLALQMLKKKAREASRKTRGDLRSIGRTPIFAITKPDGTPLLQTLTEKDEDVVVTWGFAAHDKALATCTQLVEAHGEAVTVTRFPADEFLGALLNHLAAQDIDFLLTDGPEGKLPLTTIGVRLLDSEKWTGLLNHTRSLQGANLLLAQVCMEVLQHLAPLDAVTVEQANYADLVRMFLGKKGRFPAPDLGIVWMLASSVADGVEPLYLKIEDTSPDNSTETPLVVGPLFFTSFDLAMSWPSVLPQNIGVHLADLKLHLVPFRGTGMLEEVNANFPTTTIEGVKPDLFLLDGGCLPMTTAGAGYTDDLAYGDEKPANTFSTLAQSKGELELRKASVLLLARALGIEIIHEE